MGAVTTLAGSGSRTFADGTGTAASFFYPMGVAWSPDGSKVVVADQSNHRVRLIVVATQVVTTLAGSGSATYADGTGTAASFNLRHVAWTGLRTEIKSSWVIIPMTECD
jgi:DNA-binding beta-propeller fold protein YncE